MKMKLIITAVLTLLLITGGTQQTFSADDPTAREIMQKVEDRDDGDHRTSDMLMVLIDKNNNTRKKYFKTYSKDYGKDSKQIMFIESPANIKNTGFLTYDYDASDKDDDQWLYLPALGKPKRIASSDKDGSFMGSDLNYSDMTSRDLDDFNYRILKEMKFKGADVWLIESLPKSEDVVDETGYTKSILAVRKDNYVVTRIKAWTNEGNYQKIIDFDTLTLIEGVWVAMEINVVKKLGKTVKHKTHITLSNVKFNQNLSDDLFTIRRLVKGL